MPPIIYAAYSSPLAGVLYIVKHGSTARWGGDQEKRGSCREEGNHSFTGKVKGKGGNGER